MLTAAQVVILPMSTRPPLRLSCTQVWIEAAPGSIIRPETQAQPVLTLGLGSPRVHISNVRLLGRVTVEGAVLQLEDCSIEAAGGGGSSGRRLSTSGDRGLAIDGGTVVLTRITLRGHTGGAISVHAASLILIDCNIMNNHAQSGGALMVDGDSTVRVERSNFTSNSATTNGGAIKVRAATCYHAARAPFSRRACGRR
jgi:predicted outer membrane repeat protein